MDFLLTPEAGLWGLFLSSFLAATLLPGGSEAVLLLVVNAHPEQALAALALATAGNTLGGMSTYALGRLLPQKLGAGETARWRAEHIDRLQGHGPALLLLAWTPILGDALCAAAGWLRLNWMVCALWMLLGKLARYAVLLWLL